jgi:membrane-associated protease RseP (regulator of RpoE activity)
MTPPPVPPLSNDAGLAPELAARPLPGTLGSLRPPALNIVLFVLTFASAFVAGAALSDTQLPEPTRAEMIRHGLGFSTALVAILLAHEMGHFVLSKRHGVDATWPFFIPAPLLSLIGTVGAVIRLRSLPRTRKALIDIGAAGPLAGFAVTIPILIYGLKLSTPVPLEPATAHWSLFDAIFNYLQQGQWLSPREAFDLGQPLGMTLIERLVVGDLGPGRALALHPVAVAGWFGFLLTALNLLPLGQLDGGHCLYAASPRLHRALGPPLAAVLLALGIFTAFPGWIFWGLLMGLWLGFHPPLAGDPPRPVAGDPARSESASEERLDPKRRLVLALSLAVFVLSFSPVPLATLAR